MGHLRCGKGHESPNQPSESLCRGDAVTGPWTVVGAIAAGHQGAEEIDSAIRLANGEPPYEAPAEEAIDIPAVIDEETEERPQAAMPELEPSERKSNFREVETGFAKDVAIQEAIRCLRCDLEI